MAFRKLMKATDTGGGSPATGTGSAGSGQNQGGAPQPAGQAGPNTGSGAPAGGGTPTGNAGGTPASLTPEQLAAEHAQYKSQAEQATQEVERLKSRLGKQANEIGAFNALQARMKEDPRGLSAEILKAAGMDVSQPAQFDTNSLFDERTGELRLTKESFPKFMESMQKAAADNARLEVAPEINRIFEESLRGRYSDYDDMHESRSGLQSLVLSKKMTYTELFHLAARGAHLADALDAAKAEGKAERDRELAAKAAGVVGQPGATGGGNQGHDPRDPNYLKSVVKGLQKNRR